MKAFTVTVDDRPARLGDIRLQYSSITVGTLRKLCGSFAPHCADREKLAKSLISSTKLRSATFCAT
jgi:hypothetical protein